MTHLCRSLYRAVLVLFVVLPALLLPAARPLQAQPAPSVLEDPFVKTRAERGLDLLYNMEFDEAARLFSAIDQRYPNHPIGPFLKALNTWWEILIDLSDTSHDEAFYDAMDEVIDRSDRLLKRDEDDFDAMFFKGAALGFRGRLRSNRGDWFKAAMDGRAAMRYVLRVAEREPSNHDYVFGKGIYDYYAVVVPQRYPFVRPVMVFFPDGNRERGLRELQRTAEQGTYIQTEAAYFLLQIYYLFERDYTKSVHYVSWLREQHPNNPFFHAFEGRVYARWGRWERSREIFEEVLARYERGQTGYLPATAEQALYYLARSHMAVGEYATALERLERLDEVAARTRKDTYFKVWGRLRHGMACDAMGRRRCAIDRYREVLHMEEMADSHDRAMDYLKEPYRGIAYSTGAAAER